MDVENEESCTGIAVCVFIGHDPNSWLVESHEFGADQEDEATRCATSERLIRGLPRVVITARRFSRRIGSSRRSEWRVAGHVIVESEDFRFARTSRSK